MSTAGPFTAQSLRLRAGFLATLSATNIDGTTPSQLQISATRLRAPLTTSTNTDVTDPTTLLTKAQVQAEIAAVAPNQSLDTTDSPTFAGLNTGVFIAGQIRVSDLLSGALDLSASAGVSTIKSWDAAVTPLPLELEASQVSTTAPFTASTVTATTQMVAPNLLGPVLTFGGNIGRDDDPDYLVAGARAGQNAEANLRVYSAHVCPCSGLISLGYVKESSDTHVFSLFKLNPATLATTLVSDFSLAGTTGVLTTTSAVAVGDLLLIQHNITVVPASAPDRTLVNLYLRPLGNAVPTLVSSLIPTQGVVLTAESTKNTAVGRVPADGGWEVV